MFASFSNGNSLFNWFGPTSFLHFGWDLSDINFLMNMKIPLVPQPRFAVNVHSRTLGGSKHISSAAKPNRSVGIDEMVKHETELERGKIG